MKKFSLFFLSALGISSIMVLFLNPELVTKSDISAVLQGPDFFHWFGRDQLGRDLFLRVLSGAPVSLGIGLAGSFLGFTFGILYGLTASLSPGIVKESFMRFADIMVSLPNLVLLVMLAVFFQALAPNYLALTLTLAASSWMTVARLACNLSSKEQGLAYIEAATALGAQKSRILFRHLLPNIASNLAVFWVLQIPHAILAESVLSFVGLGIQSPGVSWGLLFQEGWRSMTIAPHLLLGPAVFLFLTAFAINTLVDDFRQSVLD
jgi:oligopeptide transport system permease protein